MSQSQQFKLFRAHFDQCDLVKFAHELFVKFAHELS